MTIRTAILEARFLWGAEDMFADSRNALRQGGGGTAPRPSSSPPSSPSATSATARQGRSRYHVEPNVKDGKGGLRDLHTLFWIAQYVYRVRERADFVERGVFSKAELTLFRKAEDFLWAVRCHMHFVTAARGAAVVRHPARDRAAPRLCQPSGAEGRRALHEALISGRQGRRRPDPRFCNAPRSGAGQEDARLNRFLGAIRRAPRTALPDGGAFVVGARPHQRRPSTGVLPRSG